MPSRSKANFTGGLSSAICTHAIRAVVHSWSRNTRYLGSASDDGDAVIWDLATPTEDVYRRLKFDTGLVSIEFDPAGFRYVLIVTQGGEAALVDVRHRTSVQRTRTRHRRASAAAGDQGGDAQKDGAGRAREEMTKDWQWDLPRFSKRPATRWMFGGAAADGLTVAERTAGPQAPKDAGGTEEKSEAQESAEEKKAGAGPSEMISCATFMRDGRHIIAGTRRGRLLIYEYDAERLKRFTLDEGDWEAVRRGNTPGKNHGEWDGSPRLVQVSSPSPEGPGAPETLPSSSWRSI